MKRNFAAVLVAAGALALTACQTTGGPRTIDGTQVTYSEWRNIPESESAFQFVGNNRPTGIDWQYRMRDGGTMMHERVKFASSISFPVSSAFIETVLAGGVFNQRSSDHIRSKAAALSRFERIFGRTADEITVKESSNRNGYFLYAVMELHRDHCIAAIQGLTGSQMGAFKQLAGERFQASVWFVYCDEKSEQELLDAFASFRPNLPS